jgi:hypothetical protein
MAPHEKLLTTCATSVVSEDSRPRMDAALALPGLDWGAFVRDGIRHGLAQHAALHLAHDNHSVPEDVRRCLARLRDGNRRRNEVHFRQAALLVRAFRREGIHCLVLKGVALALTAYPDPSLRNFADIDVLVPEEEFGAACRVAAEIGYVSARREVEPLSHEETLLLHCDEDVLSQTLAPEFDPAHAPDRVRPYCRRIVLEIHRGLFRDASGLWRSVDLEPFWQRPQTVLLSRDTACRVPSPEATLVHLAGHAADHGFNRLIFLLDIVSLLGRYGPEMDWDRVHQIAERAGLGQHLAQSVTASRQLPSSGAAFTYPPVPVRCTVTLASIFANGRESRSETTLSRWLREQSWPERLVAAWRLAFPPPATIRRVYGVRSPVAVAALYLIRPFQLAGRLTAILIRKAQRALRDA